MDYTRIQSYDSVQDNFDYSNRPHNKGPKFLDYLQEYI